MARPDLVRELTAVIASGDAVLFTGAGFSAEAADRSGRSLPDSREMVRDLWTILFGDAQPDDNSLADLYDVALQRAPDRLCDYLPATACQIAERVLTTVNRRRFAAATR